jgi:hypothetical protein
MSITFDSNGHITPYQRIPSNLEALEAHFVQSFPHSHTRHRLFVNFLRYLEKFKSRVSRHFTVWVNGSFVSQKENPNDMDFVIFLDYRIYEAQEAFLDQFWTFSLEDEGMDAFLVRVFPEDSVEYHSITQRQREKWLEVYTQTKPSQYEKILPKGFIEINF